LQLSLDRSVRRLSAGPSGWPGNLPGDEIYFTQFTDRVYPVQPLSGEERLHPPIRQVDSRAGTAFYDAVASALCTLRGARNLRKAVVVITDGADQHSRLTLDQLIRTAQSAEPQIFTIGFFDDRETDIFRNSGNVVTLVNSREIDNPVKAFERISKETGAEAFFPSNQRDLERALERILGILHAQYTLAYHTSRPRSPRRIQVKVNRPGAVVASRRAVGSRPEDGGMAHFSTTSCEVSAKDHPYPWEPHVTRTPDGVTEYFDDFSDPRSGWPVRQRLRYVAGAYEISLPPPELPERSMVSTWGGGLGSASVKRIVTRAPGEIAAYGPSFTDFQASVEIESPGDGLGDGGLIFRLNERGYYLLLIQKRKGPADTTPGEDSIEYKLVKRFWIEPFDEEPIVAWTPVRISPLKSKARSGPKERFVTASVECKRNQIRVRIDGTEATSLTDDAFPTARWAWVSSARATRSFET
jgi:hypothetical protein